MLFDLDDVDVKARIVPCAQNRVRLTLEYPREPKYRDMVLSALCEMLRPAPPKPASRKRSASEREVA
jgi:hypothetical protein